MYVFFGFMYTNKKQRRELYVDIFGDCALAIVIYYTEKTI